MRALAFVRRLQRRMARRRRSSPLLLGRPVLQSHTRWKPNLPAAFAHGVSTGDAAVVLEIALFNRSPHPNSPLPIRLKKLLRGAPREVLHAWHRGSPGWAAQHAQSCPGTFRAPRFGQSAKQLFVLSLCGFGSEADISYSLCFVPKGLAASRAHAMKSCANGLSVRFFRVIIAIG